jgi:hypothetical protein
VGTLLRRKINSSGTQQRTRVGPYSRLSWHWNIIFASALLDPLLPYVITPRVPPGVALAVAAALGLFLLPCLAQARMQKTISRLRLFNQESLKNPSKAAYALILFAVSAGLLPKIFVAASLNLFVFLAVLLMLGAVLAKNFRKAVSDQRLESSLMQENPWIQIERWEMQLVTLNVIPLAAARAIGLCGVLLAADPGDLLPRLPYFVTCIAFLAMLRPDKRLFLGHCKRCRLSVPIVLVDHGSCLRCDKGLFHSYVRTMNPGLFPGPEEAQ